jgi:uncharacterized protein (TIGR02466 family)
MIHAVGSVPLLITQWNEFFNHKQSIVDVCLKNEKPNTVESNVGMPIKNNLWESQFNFLEVHSECIELKNWMSSTTADFLKEINNKDFNIAITESWAHVTRTNGWHGPHRHPWSTWSGIFHVEADQPELAQNTFQNYFDMPAVPEYSFYNESFDVSFKEGQLILFPSTMLHYAKPYLGTRRIVIAFNCIAV